MNAFGYKGKQAFPIYESKEKFEDEVNLSLMTDGENKHYVLIKDFNMFMYYKTKHRQRKHFCMYCLQRISSKEILSRHKTDCIVINEKQAIKMPEKGTNTLKFNNFHKQLPVPFFIHVDFEAITEKIYICVPDNQESYTDAYHKHADCGYGHKVVCCYNDKYTRPVQILPAEAFKHTSEVFKDEKFKLMKQRGVHPYGYIDSLNKFDEKLQGGN